jgi:hypothetical protein
MKASLLECKLLGVSKLNPDNQEAGRVHLCGGLTMGTLVRAALLYLLFCVLSSLTFADSVQTIPISGAGWKGQPFIGCCYYGDFRITGPNLFLNQTTPDGSAVIGSCVLGEVCDFSYAIGNASAFCTLCTLFSFGSLDGKTANYLDAVLTFSGSALYSGASTMIVPMTVTGSIVGYQMVNCTDGYDCTLGPVQFRLNIVGQGEATVSLNDSDEILGIYTDFTGTATTPTVTPEPISLVLTGTGLVGIWIKRKLGPSSTMS